VTLTTCLGGHAPPLLARKGTVRSVGSAGTLLGVMPRVTLSEQRTQMRTGDVLLLYTDGLADEPGSPAPFTPEDLGALLARMSGSSAEHIAVEIERHLGERRRGSSWGDDVAYLVARCVE
jgi:serine phosphatase RsbU (regulator of sigma subunit)